MTTNQAIRTERFDIAKLCLETTSCRGDIIVVEYHRRRGVGDRAIPLVSYKRPITIDELANLRF